MDVRSIMGIAGAGVVGVAGFFGFDNADKLGNVYKNLTIAADSTEASFLVGDWCGRQGERQRFERREKELALFSCVPASGQVCGSAAFAHGGAGGAKDVELGWADGHLTYRIAGEQADINVNKIDDSRFQAYLASGLGFSEWARCGADGEAAPGASPALNVQVEPYSPEAQLYVIEAGGEFRVAPRADAATLVARAATGGERLTVRGRTLQADGYWYEVRLDGGVPAFIQASLATDVTPAGAVPVAVEPALTPEEITAALPTLRITEEPRALAGADGRPEMPKALQRAKAYGAVTMDLCVAADGRVTDAKVAASSGKAKLDAMVLKWLETARFDPAKANDAPVDYCGFRIVYDYSAS
jgi:TonB family protein